MRELEDLLPTLQVPAGGLARLQRHASTHRSRDGMPRNIRGWAWPAAACVAVATAVIVIQPLVMQRRQVQALTLALRQAMSANSPATGIRVTDGAAIELPSGQSNVKLYLVEAAHAEMEQGATQNDMK